MKQALYETVLEDAFKYEVLAQFFRQYATGFPDSYVRIINAQG